MSIKKYTLYGERGTGTNYLENLMDINFNAELTWEYGHKHFPGFCDEKLRTSDDTLFICIIRNIYDWLNSFYRPKWHLPLKFMTELTEEEKIHKFLNEEFYSIKETGDMSELPECRNIYTGERYKNIFELRYTKHNFFINLHKKVKNVILIRYEDLVQNFDNTMLRIKNKGLSNKHGINFPINSNQYKDRKNVIYIPNSKYNFISINLIYSNKNLIKKHEEGLGYYNNLKKR